MKDNSNAMAMLINHKEDDREAVREIVELKREVKLIGPVAEERTPILYADNRRIYGIKSIKNYITSEKKKMAI
jgi:hypothetical protein